ncbi:polymorphic toxin-type HINT domain-containing protein, partial [Hydrogenophaga sp.]
GKVVYQACFAAGTLVHTDQGPLPIEKVRVGTKVLSQPENGGKIAYKPVINTVAHLDQQVHAVQVKVEGSDELTTLITTPNHPFWVQERLVHDQHWLAAEHLAPGMVLQIAGVGAGANAGEHIAPGLVATRYATVYANGLIRHTQHAHIGFAADDRVGAGMVLDLSDPKNLRLLDPAQTDGLGTLELGEPLLTPVYNFSVDEFHTYYVGNSAVWVHNSCGPEGAVDAVFEKATIEGECFSGDTLVVVEPWTDNFNGGVSTNMLYIERVEVGDTVLSRCELTGEMAYKQVTKVFTHGWRTSSDISFECGPEFYEKYPTSNPPGITTTANHPFWVQGKGWTKVEDLKPGDEMLTYDGIKATVKHVSLNNSGTEVYNLEVEDFHTYFVASPGIWVHNKSPLKFDRLNANAVPDPKPQWTPQHKGEAALIQRKAVLEQRKSELTAITTKTPAEVKELKDVNRKLTETTTALQEIQPRKGQKFRPDPEKFANDPVKKNGAIGELQAADILAKHDNLQIVHLPPGTGNTLGKAGGRPDKRCPWPPWHSCVWGWGQLVPLLSCATKPRHRQRPDQSKNQRFVNGD